MRKCYLILVCVLILLCCTAVFAQSSPNPGHPAGEIGGGSFSGGYGGFTFPSDRALIIQQNNTCSYTGSGSICWDADDKRIMVGNGSGSTTFSSGTGSAGHVAIWTGTYTLNEDSGELVWDAASNELGVHNSDPDAFLEVNQLESAGTGLIVHGGDEDPADNYHIAQFRNWWDETVFVIKGGGRVGINTTNPNSTLHVQDGMIIGNNSGNHVMATAGVYGTSNYYGVVGYTEALGYSGSYFKNGGTGTGSMTGTAAIADGDCNSGSGCTHYGVYAHAEHGDVNYGVKGEAVGDTASSSSIYGVHGVGSPMHADDEVYGVFGSGGLGGANSVGVMGHDRATTGTEIGVWGLIGDTVTWPASDSTYAGYFTGAYVKIGDGGTITDVDGDGDLYVEDELEVDGAFYMPDVTFMEIADAGINPGSTPPTGFIRGSGTSNSSSYLNGVAIYDPLWVTRDLHVDGDLDFPDVYLTSNTGYYVRIDSAGNVGSYASSSLKVKENIEDMGDTAWVYDLRPVTFEFKVDEEGNYAEDGTPTGVRDYGLIAEEVYEVNPSFVIYGLNNSVDGVDYMKFVSPMINEMKRLKQVNDRQQSEIDTLRSEIEELKKRLE